MPSKLYAVPYENNTQATALKETFLRAGGTLDENPFPRGMKEAREARAGGPLKEFYVHLDVDRAAELEKSGVDFYPVYRGIICS